MIRTMALCDDDTFTTSLSIEDILTKKTFKWYWIDFGSPTLEETHELEKLGFHPLAIKDCLRFLQKPKLDYYGDYQFVVLHAMNPTLLQPEEVDVFVAPQFLVTFHYQDRIEINQLWERITQQPDLQQQGTQYIQYKLIDKLVDFYFPIVQKIEDRLTQVENHMQQSSKNIEKRLKEIYQIRSDLLSLRHSILPMQDLLYRILNSQKLNYHIEEQRYYSDIHDHLNKLSSMIESSRSFTNDIQDHYLSINAYRMNTIMMTLTVFTTIFMPLTLISSIYGMNFKYMPELEWPFGYFLILILMLIIGVSMFLWFKLKGWFDSN